VIRYFEAYVRLFEQLFLASDNFNLIPEPYIDSISDSQAIWSHHKQYLNRTEIDFCVCESDVKRGSSPAYRQAGTGLLPRRAGFFHWTRRPHKKVNKKSSGATFRQNKGGRLVLPRLNPANTPLFCQADPPSCRFDST